MSSDPAAYTCIPSDGSLSRLLEENYPPFRHGRVPRIGPQLLRVPREQSEVEPTDRGDWTVLLRQECPLALGVYDTPRCARGSP